MQDNMEDVELVIRGKRIVGDKHIFSGYICIRDGKIVSVSEEGFDGTKWKSCEVIDAGDQVVMPGVVDSHVHVNEPGRTQWEGFETASQAAAAGGITTIVDMPLNSIPPTTTVAGFRQKLESAKNCWVDVAFWGGVVPGNQDEIIPLVEEGVKGFKCFMIHSGVDEFPHVSEMDLNIALQKIKETEAVLMFHAEVELPQEQPEGQDPQKYSSFLSTRPEEMENEAIRTVARLCQEFRVPCHIVHLSSASALPILREARSNGAPLTVETTHHYLSLTAEGVPDGATQFKCCPPIRTAANQEALWKAIESRDIDLVVSDHSPCTLDLKLLDRGDFLAAWGGISSLQFGLSLFWSSACKRGLDLHDLVRVMCEEPAKLARLQHCKGRIAVGMDADFVLWDPQATFVVDQQNALHRNKITPYNGMKLQGVVRKTIVRGQVVFDEGKLSPSPLGRQLLEPIPSR